jgi:coenzyme F420-reducing hydrogenase gamma subunit
MSERAPLLDAKKDQPTLSERHVISSSSSATAVDGQSVLGEDVGLSEESVAGEESDKEMENLSRKSQWIVLALASGGCAAFNGVFAKL